MAVATYQLFTALVFGILRVFLSERSGSYPRLFPAQHNLRGTSIQAYSKRTPSSKAITKYAGNNIPWRYLQQGKWLGYEYYDTDSYDTDSYDSDYDSASDDYDDSVDYSDYDDYDYDDYDDFYYYNHYSDSDEEYFWLQTD